MPTVHAKPRGSLRCDPVDTNPTALTPGGTKRTFPSVAVGAVVRYAVQMLVSNLSHYQRFTKVDPVRVYYYEVVVSASSTFKHGRKKTKLKTASGHRITIQDGQKAGKGI